jgi:molybdate transport system permease protein
MDQFRCVVLPLCRRSFITAASLGFAHTVGEFGVVLMIGGNIPGETRVLSIALYDQVESLQFAQAHRLAGGLMLFSIVLLFLLYRSNPQGLWRSR